MERRPAFEEIKTYEEFSKYYWYREELVVICKWLGICVTGYKAELNKRLEEYFKGKPSQIKKCRRKIAAKKTVSELSLETGLIECDFRFSQRFRDFFSEETGIKNFKFNADMVASVRTVRETGDYAFTLGDLLDIYYGRKSYAKYDKVSLQWNKFVKDFCADPVTAQFPNKLKVAARLWKEVRESTREKVYKHELLEEFGKMLKQISGGTQMPFDYKKEYKELYLPPAKPQLVHIPKMQFVAVRGKGNPNDREGEYQKALAILYALSYTIKMSKMGDQRIDGYFDYVVPPLEGFWWQEKNGAVVPGFDYKDKSSFNWISIIRLPDFVRQKDFDWAKERAAEKKGLDCSHAELLTIEEGDCIQIMHKGAYDDEPASIQLVDEYAETNDWQLDFSATRLHHEIYLSDPRKTSPENLKTVIRHPVKKIGE